MPEELKKNYMEVPIPLTKAKRKAFKPIAKPKSAHVVCRVEMTSGPTLCLADIEHPDLSAVAPDPFCPQLPPHSPVTLLLYIVASATAAAPGSAGAPS